MSNYCTLFDSFYLSRGLALYESLKTHSKEFHLYIFAFDDISFSILRKMDLQNTTIISLNEFETPELLEVKKGRTKAEYCWTCTPSTISYVLKYYNVTSCTYLDSDLFFFSDPAVLIEEMAGCHKNVLITEHRYSLLPKLYEEKRSGRFCVQFVTFTNDPDSLKILEKWRLQCIDWCYARHEEGKFGDQKYLDEWPELYKNVHILEHQGGGVAPWNLMKYRFKKYENQIKGKVKKTGLEFYLVFFHFQYVRFLENGTYDIGWYQIPAFIRSLFYLPYLGKIKDLENRLIKLYPGYQPVYSHFKRDNIKEIIKTGLKKIFGYNIINTKH